MGYSYVHLQVILVISPCLRGKSYIYICNYTMIHNVSTPDILKTLLIRTLAIPVTYK